jgi:ribosomal RNA-processing protein 12
MEWRWSKKEKRRQTVRTRQVIHSHISLTSSQPVKASIEEYITMVAAGLVGATPHMISATITALSRLTFEFKSTLQY